MGRQQILRGNPENKLVITNDNFSQGVNLVDGDDLISDSSFRYLKNVDLGELGSLSTRKGWGAVSPITEVFDLINDKVRLAGYPDDLFIPNLTEDKPNILETNEDGSISVLKNTTLGAQTPQKPKLIDVTHSSIHAVSQIIEEGMFQGALTTRHVASGEPIAFGFSKLNINYNPVYIKVLIAEKKSITGPTNNQETIYGYEAISNTVLINDFTRDNYEGVLIPTKTVSRKVVNDDGVVTITEPVLLVITGYGEFDIPNFKLELGTKVTSSKSNIKQMLLFKLVTNEYNLWERLVRAKTTDEVIRLMPSDQTHKLDMLFVYEEKNGDMKARRVGINVQKTGITVDTSTARTWTKDLGVKAGGSLKSLGEGYFNLMNISHGVQGEKVFFTSNNHGLISIGADTNSVEYLGAFPGKTNSAYKPTPLEVRKVGFNVLGNSPLTWINRSGLATKSVQGIYVMTSTGIPVDVLPAGQTFKLAIMYTGTTEPAWKLKFATNFLEESADEKEISHTKTKDDSLSVVGALTVYNITLTTQVQTSVYITIDMGDEAIAPYRDVYDVGEISPNAKQVQTLNLGEYEVTRMGNRNVFYAKDTIWFSEFDMYNYVPNLNYVILPINPSDDIVAIKFFRSSYLIFTREKIYKLMGTYGSSDFGVSIVSDNMGCISPKSIAMVNNMMYFLSATGLHALRSETFRADLEQIKRIDEKVAPVILKNNQAFGYVDNDQYVLNLNHNYAKALIPGYTTTVQIESRDYLIPDAVRHYYEFNAFTFDTFAEGRYPKFLFQVSGDTFAFLNRKVYNRVEQTTDFGSVYDVEVETVANNVGYPNHEKKFKDVVLKLGQKFDEQNFDIDVYADGYRVASSSIFENHELEYSQIESSKNGVKKVRLNSTKCKNIALNIRTTSENAVSIRALSYTFKLGKMRE